MGGGMGGGGMGGGGMGGGGGGGGGLFNVAPEKAGKLKVINVCLEHGKKDPSPRVAYEIIPIASFNKDPNVIEMVKMLARGEIDQHAAQAAAWHLANGLTFEQLASKNRAVHLSGATEKFFSPKELQVAIQVVSEANKRGEAAAKQASEKPKSQSENQSHRENPSRSEN